MEQHFFLLIFPYCTNSNFCAPYISLLKHDFFDLTIICADDIQALSNVIKSFALQVKDADCLNVGSDRTDTVR